MTNFTLYRKEIEILEITREKFEKRKYHEGYRESIAELFLDSDNHLREDFLEIIPVNELEWVKKLIVFLSTITSSSSNGLIRSISMEKNVKDVINEITKLQDLIQTQCNERFYYGVFYSWQSDIDQRCNRNFIESALEKAIKETNKKISKGPLLSLDKDTRNVPGSPDITPMILQKVDNSICFVADVTPITRVSGKQIPNPNVMLELGYALSTLGFERVILICNIAKCDLRDLPFDLGLKRVMTYQYEEPISEDEKRVRKQKLTDDLVRALMAIVT